MYLITKKWEPFFFKEMKKTLVNQIFFLFNLPTDRLHKNGLPQIHHSKDQLTMA